MSWHSLCTTLWFIMKKSTLEATHRCTLQLLSINEVLSLRITRKQSCMELNIFLSIGPQERPLMESRLTPPLARAFSCWANVICSAAAEAVQTDNFDMRDAEDAEGEQGIGSHIRMHMFAYASSAVSGNRGRGPPATYFEAPT